MSAEPEPQESSGSKPVPKAKRARPERGFLHRLIRALFILGSAVVLILVLAGAWLYWNGNALLTAYAESDAFREMLSRQVGKSLKVEGTFEPIVREGWTARTGGFTSVGLPGQVITRLDAKNASGRFDPDGIWKKLWEFDYIRIEQATLGLQSPKLSNKPKPKPPKPWYAVFLPTRFYPKVVEARAVDLQWEFREKPASINPIHLFVTPDGINWEFTGTGGTLNMALAPQMWLKEISVHMSKPYFDVQSATFVGMEPGDPAWLTAQAKMGLQPADRSLTAHIKLNHVDIDPAIPERLRPFLDAKASGDIEWYSNPDDPKATRASGSFSLAGTRITQIPFLQALQPIHQNEQLTALEFQKAGLTFDWVNDVFSTNDLVLKSDDIIWLEAKATVPKDLDIDAQVQIKEMNFGPWLPGVSGTVTGFLDWKGDPTKLETSNAKGKINLDGTQLHNVPMLANLAQKTGIARLRNLPLNDAWIDFSLAEGIARLDQFVLNSTGNIALKGDAAYTVESQKLAVNTTIQELELRQWLPAALRVHLDGIANGTLHYRGDLRDLKGAQVYGRTQILGAVIKDLKVLGILARFFKDDSFLELKLNPAAFRYDIQPNHYKVTHIDIRCPGKVWITGWVQVARSGGLAGTLNLGIAPEFLTWLPEDGKEVFTKYRSGYRWTPVKISGTMKKPQQDLVKRIEANIMDHPFSLLGLIFRLISWLLGDLFGYDGPGADALQGF